MDTTYPNLTNAGWQAWGRSATRQIEAGAAALGVAPAAAAAARAAFDIYDAALDAALDPETRSKPRVRAKNDALVAFRRAVAPVVATIQANPAVPDERREELGLNVRDRTHTAATLPAAAPTVSAMLTGPQSLRVVASDPLDPRRRAKPRGTKQLAVHAFRGAAGISPPADVAAWPLESLSGRTTVDLTWPELAGDATVWVSCCWVSSRSELGAFSQPTSVRLPGSGMIAAAQQAASETAGMKIAA